MQAQYVDHMGSDDSVANAARVSFDKLASMYTEDQNNKLIRFLARGCSTGDWTRIIHRLSYCTDEKEIEDILLAVKHLPTHWTPFAHTAITLRMKAPIPIRTQCFKHKQGFVENEESRRYIRSMPDLFTPDEMRSVPEGSIKQGSGGVHEDSEAIKGRYETEASFAIDEYEHLIDRGVAPEQARLVLPQGVEVQWIWTGNLVSFANFYNKRTDSHAQGEIQKLARMVGDIVQPLFPVSWDALTGGK
jgi:thymidylate synthase (FAD)